MGLEERGDRHVAPPVPVAGEMVEQPADLGLDRLAVADAGADPLRRSLEDEDLIGLLGDRREQLHAGRAVAEDRDALARRIEVVGPAGGVQDRPAEALPAFELGEPRIREGADGADEDVGLEGFAAPRRRDLEHPEVARFVEGRLREIVLEAGLRVDAVFARDHLDVFAHLAAAGEVLAPGMILLEQEFVGDRDGVDADVGVAVDAPGSARIGPAVQHHIGDAEALELDAHRDPAEAGSDDDDLEARRKLRPGVRPVDHQGEVLECGQVAAGLEIEVVHVFAGRHVHELAEERLRRLGRHPGPRVLREPGGRLRDQARAAGLVELRRGGKRRKLRIARLLIERHPHGVQVRELDRSPDEVPIDHCCHPAHPLVKVRSADRISVPDAQPSPRAHPSSARSSRAPVGPACRAARSSS